MKDGERQRATVDYYDDQTDNYLQINNQLVLSHRFNEKWTLNATGFYTYGYGFYKQYKDARTLSEYLNIPTDVAAGKGGRPRPREDHAQPPRRSERLGGLLRCATSTSPRRFVQLLPCPTGACSTADGLEGSQIGGRWYDNDVDKHDANLFARANWSVAKGLRLFADLQYRYVSYQAWGVNDNYVSEEVGMQPIDVDKQYHFFNPRAGVSYTLAERNNSTSFAVAQKEPTRSDFTDRYKFAADDTYPSSKSSYDWGAGLPVYTAPRLSLGVNLYYMKYKDQLVPTGMVNDDSNALNTNVPDSYRRGVELSASWRATGWFTVGANATFSQNRIENYVDALKDSPTYGKELGDMTIAYSPDVIANAFLNFHHRGFEAVFHTQHVGKQYFTNNENDALSLDAYCVTNLNLAYTFRTRSARSVRLGLLINNLFNAEYESNGYGYSYMDTWSGPAPVRMRRGLLLPRRRR